MRKLWLVGCGYYSDRDFVCVCPSEEIANAVYARFGGENSDYWLEEVEMIEEPTEVSTRKVYRCTLRVDEELNIKPTRRGGVDEYERISTGFTWEPEGVSTELHDATAHTKGGGAIFSLSYASAEAAKKAAYDKLAEARAMREGI